MAAAIHGDWNRDHHADANPDLTRKRQRLSEEAEAPPDASDESVVIEALPVEDCEVVDNAIELQDEMSMEAFGSSLQLDPNVHNITPTEQLKFCLKHITDPAGHLRPLYFERLSSWLERHIAHVPPHSPGLREKYLDETEFFSVLGMLCRAIIEHEGILFGDEREEYKLAALARSFATFIPATMALAHRLVRYLPSIVDSAVARRDSAQTARTRQPIHMLSWAQVLTQIMTLQRAAQLRGDARTKLGYKPKSQSESWRQDFRTRRPTLVALTKLLHNLGQHHREIENAWEAIDAILQLVLVLELPASEEVQSLLATNHLILLPHICEKHPRALPEGFHRTLVVVTRRLLDILVDSASEAELADLYRQYIKSEHDALVAEHASDDDMAVLLQGTSDGSQETLRSLLNTAWVLQAYRAYIFSEIMDVRSNGLSLLSQCLLEIYKDYDVEHGGAEHPMPQYAARFLRKNELTKYMFGPESHASLVKHCQSVIGFLAVTGAYTALETDIIWNACTNSVESEFAAAAFGVLEDVSKYLELDHLLHLAKKYTITEPSKLGQSAVDSLTSLFQRVHVRSDFNTERSLRLATAFISIDIMMRVDATGQNAIASQLRDTAKVELLRFTQSARFDAQDRVQIFGRCTPHIITPSTHATTSVEIVDIFLREGISAEEACELLVLLPVVSVVEELTRYADKHRLSAMDPEQTYDMIATDVRIDLLGRLLAYANSKPSAELRHSIFTCTVGPLAICNNARDRAWRMFSQSTPMTHEMVLQWLEVEVIDLSPQFTTPYLLQLLMHKLVRWQAGDPDGGRLSQILDLSDWHKLVQIAESPCAIAAEAQELVCHVLFVTSGDHADTSSATECQVEFVLRQIRSICNVFDHAGHAPTKDHVAQIVGKLGLLQAVLDRSKQNAARCSLTQSPDLRLVDDSCEDSVCYRLEVHGTGRSQPVTILLHARPETKVSELSLKLPSITGAAENRVIVAGKEINLEKHANDSLSDLGLQLSGVISISAKHTIKSDLDKVLTMPGVLEHQVLEHYDELEVLLDAPGPIAAKISDLLIRISTPKQVRQKLYSSDYTSERLFPAEGTWRSMFYLDALHKHLHNLARLGIADGPFVLRGIALLVKLLTKSPRTGQEDVCIRAMRVLTSYLREKPQETSTGAPMDEAHQFSSCIIRICEDALSRPAEQAPMRHALINCAFELLQEVCRQQPQVWQAFTEHSNVAELHSTILFESDRELSTHAANMIRNFCIDESTPDAAIEFYTNIMLQILPRALEHDDRATIFFDLTTKLLLDTSTLYSEESRARDITRSLLSTLWNYEHVETADVPVLDLPIIGILGLLKESVQILRSYKKPLELQGLAANLITEFLFPESVADSGSTSGATSKTGSSIGYSRQLFHPQSRHAVYELVKAVCVTKEDFGELFQALAKPLDAAETYPSYRYPGRKEQLRAAAQCAGLTNLGQTCYMNSLLQQLYANVAFRQFILDTPTDMHRPNQQVLLQALKNLFGRMQNSMLPVMDTESIATALGTQVGSQEDVHGFYEDFLSKLELEMPNKAAKDEFARFYTGKLITQVKGDCGHISPRTESFVDLPIVVKNKRNLAETLDELVQGEPMRGANQYRCQACDPDGGGRLVDAMRRSCLDVIPDNLTFCLKRFEYDPIVGGETKINDRFEFPQTIDMSSYQFAHLDNPQADVTEDIFELVGVIVHMGTMDFGHYWSYTLLRNTDKPDSRVWVKLEDRNATTCQDGLLQVQHECFGGLRFNNGNERSDNAYVLLYQRKQSLEKHISLPGITVDPESRAVLPPRVAFENALEDNIRAQNARLFRTAHLFDDDLSALLKWAMDRCKQSNFMARSDIDSSQDSSSEASSEGEKMESQIQDVPQAAKHSADGIAPVDAFVVSLSGVVSTFMQNIATCDPLPVKKLGIGILGLNSLIADHHQLASCVLGDLTKDDWFWSILGHNRKNASAAIQTFVWQLLSVVREHDPGTHDSMVTTLRDIHANYLHAPEDVAALDWVEYLAFAAKVAALSPADTAAVLDAGYWSWVFEMLRLPFDQAIRGKYPGLFEQLNLMPKKVAALYEFVLGLFEGHLAIPDLSTHSPEGGPHAIKDGKVLLTRSELEMLAEKLPGSAVFIWLRSSRYADVNTLQGWKDFMPGKLLGLLVSQDTCPRLSQALQANLLQHIDCEEEQLSSILNLAMHYCTRVRSEADACLVFAAAVHVAPSWEGSEGELMQILPSAFETIPRVALTTLELWAKHFLLIKASALRKSTATTLIAHAFDADADLDEPDMVVVRAKLGAQLVREGEAELRQAYNEEKPRNRYESLIDVYKHLVPYLQSFRRSVSEKLRSGNVISMPPDLMAEYDRAQQTLARLEDLGALIDEWESEYTLPTGVVRSREEESEDYDTDEVNGEWDSSSDFAA